jgi:hypothetical protein
MIHRHLPKSELAYDLTYVWEHHTCAVCDRTHIAESDGIFDLKQVAVMERCPDCSGWLLWCHACAIGLGSL